MNTATNFLQLKTNNNITHTPIHDKYYTETHSQVLVSHLLKWRSVLLEFTGQTTYFHDVNNNNYNNFLKITIIVMKYK